LDLSVGIVSLDNCCQYHDIERIDLMKMDGEGREYEPLLGAQWLLEKQSVGCIFLELNEWAAKRSGCSTGAIRGLLVDAGYHLFSLSSLGLIPIDAETVTPGENAITFAREPEWPQS